MASARRSMSNCQCCAAPNCNNSRTKCPEMVFHSFPVEERRLILDLLKKCVCKSKVIDAFPCENMREKWPFAAKSRGATYLCEAIESLVSE